MSREKNYVVVEIMCKCNRNTICLGDARLCNSSNCHCIDENELLLLTCSFAVRITNIENDMHEKQFTKQNEHDRRD